MPRDTLDLLKVLPKLGGRLCFNKAITNSKEKLSQIFMVLAMHIQIIKNSQNALLDKYFLNFFIKKRKR
jgi:hypothetical protein